MSAERLSRLITRHPGGVVVVFLLVTALFVPGMAGVEIEEDLEDFVVDTPEYETYQEVNDEFGGSFDEGRVETWLIQISPNAVSRTSLLRMLRAQERLEDHDDLYVKDSSSVAGRVASHIDPSAGTTGERVEVLEAATDSEVREAVRAVADEVEYDVSEDFNPESAVAGSTVATVVHDFPDDVDTEAVTGTATVVEKEQLRMREVVDSVGGEIRVYGFGIMYHEFERVINESMAFLLPFVLVIILFFLGVAYRDPVDVVLGSTSLLIALVWTFGFMGYAGVSFTQLDVAIPPLMLAVGVDFSIHAVNRYKEELSDDDRREAMGTASRQLLVAFLIVTATTSVGFLANLTSRIGPVRDFGLVAGVGIIFVALVFGVFFPAAKLYLDELRGGGHERALGREGSALGRVLSLGAVPARHPGVFLAFVLVVTAAGGVYATGVSTSFDEKDFLPPEDTPGYVEAVPEPMQPGEYTTKRDMLHITNEYESDTVTVGMYVEGNMESDGALDALGRASRTPPDMFIRGDDGDAEARSVVDVIRERAARDKEFARLVDRSDGDGDGVPDGNLGEVYDALLNGETRDETVALLSDDRDGALVQYRVEADALYEDIAADAEAVAEDHRFEATPTGDMVVYSGTAGLVFESAFTAFAAALVLSTVVLVVSYGVLEGRAALGLANAVPVIVTAVGVVGTMRFLGIPFNALTATILAVTVGTGVDYSVHVTHRFADEYEQRSMNEALDRSLRGTGGALTGSMLTTIGGTGVLVLAVTPILREFGFLMVVSITYAYLASVVVLPAVLVAWERMAA